MVWVAVAGLALALTGCGGASAPGGQRASEMLRQQVASAGERAVLRVGPERIHAAQALPRFYQKRRHQLAWIAPDGCPSPAATELARFIGGIGEHGLRPAHYHLAAITEQMRRAVAEGCQLERWEQGRAAGLDLLLTDAFLLLASHLAGGRINPESLDPEWLVTRRGVDPPALLRQALASGEISRTLSSAAPPHPAYAALMRAASRYRGLNWSSVGAGDDLKTGARGERVVRLRQRLQAAGLSAAGEGDTFDAALEAAVRSGQAHLGLPLTGVADAATIRELDRPPAERVRQIEANLERWRWLPDDLGPRHVVVRVPAFELAVVQDGRDALTMRAVVGKTHRRTPMLSSTLKTVVINPSWQVPHRIAVKDLIPQIRKDPGYLRKNGITLYAGWTPDARVVDPVTVDWRAATMKTFRLRMRQQPGPDNALGRIKFLFPNKYDVYMHDTPKRHLFRWQQRTFSSGCIRLEKPLDLADALLRGDKGWTRARIRGAMGGGELAVAIPRPVPVHLTYFTAWIDAAGAAHFRTDVYRRDRRLLAALDRPPPRAR